MSTQITTFRLSSISLICPRIVPIKVTVITESKDRSSVPSRFCVSSFKSFISRNMVLYSGAFP